MAGVASSATHTSTKKSAFVIVFMLPPYFKNFIYYKKNVSNLSIVEVGAAAGKHLKQ
jgi:16S rRNA G966 N2-methylase RsmD